MTVTSATRKAGPFLGNGVNTLFPFTFKVFSASNVLATFTDGNGTDTVLTLDNQYSVSLNSDQDNNPGGTLIYPRVGSGISALPTGSKLTLTGSLPYDQQTDLPNPGPYYAQTIEDTFDREEIQIQQLKEISDRSIKIGVSDAPLLPLPGPSARANQLLGFDAIGGVGLFPLPASVGAGDLKNEAWTDGIDYTAGVSASVLLSRAYGTKANLGTVVMAGVAQDPASYSLAGQVLTFDAIIPLGVTRIWCVGGTTLSTVVTPDGSVDDAKIAPGSRLYARLNAEIYSTDYGAVPNGVSDTTAALAQADAAAVAQGGDLVFLPGIYYLASNLSLNAPARIMPGATFSVAGGVTLTFSNQFKAGVQKVFNFTSAGTAVFNAAKNTVGYPEWWGAVTNDGSADCTAAINTCIISLPVTQLQLADYYCNGSIFLGTPHRALRGVTQDFDGLTPVTSIITKGGTLTSVVMGPLAAPGGGINAYMQGLRLEDLNIRRTVGPTISSGPWGVGNRWTLFSSIQRVVTYEHTQGFYIGSAVYAKYTDCRGFRSAAGVGGGTDTYIGFNIDGSLGTGNASVYLDRCNTSLGGTATPRANVVGFLLGGACNDIFITRPETAQVGYGIQFNGTGSAVLNYGAVDCQITNPILDQCAVVGMLFQTTTIFGAISVKGGYAALDGSATNGAAIIFTNSAASVDLDGFQCIMGTSLAGTPGISATTSRRIDSRCVIKECSGSAVSLTGVSDSRFCDNISNDSITGGVNGAVFGSAVSRTKFESMVNGKNSAWAIGYAFVGAANNYNEWNCTGLNSAAVTTKLSVNGVTITTQGVPVSNTTDYVSGVMV